VVLRVVPRLDVPRDSFFQNNFFLLPALLETVRERVRDSRVRNLVDAYCGVGFFAVELADQVKAYAGIEIDLLAVQAARRQRDQPAPDHGEFLQGDVTKLLPELLKKFSADSNRGSSRSAAGRLLAGQPRTAATDASGAGHSRLLSSGDAGARLEGSVRRRSVRAGESGSVGHVSAEPQHVECVADVRARPELAASGDSLHQRPAGIELGRQREARRAPYVASSPLKKPPREGHRAYNTCRFPRKPCRPRALICLPELFTSEGALPQRRSARAGE